MTRRLKNLFFGIGVLSGSLWLAGCEAEAEEQAGSDSTSGEAPVPLVVDAPVTNVPGTASTIQDGTTNAVNITNQQTTIVQQIAPTLPEGIDFSEGVEEIVKLAHAGVSETVILLYIEKAEHPFDLDAAEIVYLNDIGVSATVIAAMLNHDGASPELHNVLATNAVEIADAPVPLPETNDVTISQSIATAEPPQSPVNYEVSSNYVAAPQPGGTVVQDPNVQYVPADPGVAVQQPVVVQQQPVLVTQPAVTYSYFYSSLSPYGSWIHTDDYGWSWRPTVAVVNSGWRPYLHGGRWLYSDVGWYWHSDYSWGWAPFHYGRWYCSPRHGWVWTPGYTWGPSWVTWRRSGAYCGWAPLPPRTHVRPGLGFSYYDRDVGFSFSFGYTHDFYTFVPASRFCEPRLSPHVLPTHRTGNIYRNSTVVNNYIVGNNNTIINNGIGRDYVATHSRREIPRVRVAEAPSRSGRTIQPDRLVRSGTETVVFRPTRPSPESIEQHERALSRQEAVRGAGSSAQPQSPWSAAPIRSRDSSRSALVRPGANGDSGSVAERLSPAQRSEPRRTGASTEPIGRPIFGRPAPVRPEPQPALAGGNDPNTPNAPNTIGSRFSRPSSTASTVSPRGQPVTPRGTPSAVGAGVAVGREPSTVQPGPSGLRPGSSGIGALPSRSARSEAGRGTVTPGRPGTTPQTPQVQDRLQSVQPAVPPSISGRPLPGPGPSLDSRFSRPVPAQSQPQSNSSAAAPAVRPAVPNWGSRGTVQPAPRTIAPGVTRAAPQPAPPATQIGRSPVVRQPSSGPAAPGFSRGTIPGGSTTTTPSTRAPANNVRPVPSYSRPVPNGGQSQLLPPGAQTLQSGRILSQPAPALQSGRVLPQTSGSITVPGANVGRSEPFGGSSRVAPPIRSVQPPVVQPRSITPVQTFRPAPSVSAPSRSLVTPQPQRVPPSFRAPPVSSAPRPAPAVRPPPSFRAPPQPAGNPSVIGSRPAPSRGRVEIGR